MDMPTVSLTATCPHCGHGTPVVAPLATLHPDRYTAFPCSKCGRHVLSLTLDAIRQIVAYQDSGTTVDVRGVVTIPFATLTDLPPL